MSAYRTSAEATHSALDDDRTASADYAAEQMAQDAFERREWDRGAGVLDPEPSNPWLPGGRFWPPDEETLRGCS